MASKSGCPQNNAFPVRATPHIGETTHDHRCLGPAPNAPPHERSDLRLAPTLDQDRNANRGTPGLGHPRDDGLEMPNDSHLSLFAADIDEAVAEVKGRCDEVLHISEGNDQIIWFKDPAGNTIEFQQDTDVAS